jgi:hypothetical protein
VEIKPRYEFRVWSDRLASVHEKLGCLAPAKIAEDSRATRTATVYRLLGNPPKSHE